MGGILPETLPDMQLRFDARRKLSESTSPGLRVSLFVQDAVRETHWERGWAFAFAFEPNMGPPSGGVVECVHEVEDVVGEFAGGAVGTA